MPSATPKDAYLVRPANPATAQYVATQIEQIRLNRSRVLGAGPFIDSLLVGLIEARVNFADCHGRSDVSSKLARLLDARFTSPLGVR